MSDVAALRQALGLPALDDPGVIWSRAVERHLLGWAINVQLREELLATVDRMMSAEVVGFRPLGILAASEIRLVGYREPAEPGSATDYVLNHELPKITRAERNERAVAWWRQSTGRAELWRDPRHDAVPAERYSPLTSMAAWSATQGQPRTAGPSDAPVADPRRD